MIPIAPHGNDYNHFVINPSKQSNQYTYQFRYSVFFKLSL